MRRITFLDTPGHEAFKALRARGAAAADIAILVIAADEGVKPQTEEAFAEITATGIPYVVAFTKTDKNGADVERVKIAALEAGIYLEGLGGSVPYAGVSSKTGDGIPELLDLVLLTADLADLKADPATPASGFVLESSQDPKRGISATLIIKDGTLNTGTFVVAGSAMAPVRFIEDFLGKRLTEAGPSLPVAVSGWSALPSAGAEFITVASKKEAEKLAADKETRLQNRPADVSDGKETFAVVIKADVTGSIEAIVGLLSKLQHDRISFKVVSSGVGAVSEGDVKVAQAANGIILAFHVPTESLARDLALRTNVAIESFDIIYELQEKVEALFMARAPRITTEQVVGELKVLKNFSSTGTKHVLGARHVSGQLTVGDRVKVVRRGVELGYGKLLNLQVARTDVQEIHVEGEFGLQVESKVDVSAGDELQSVKMIES